MQRFKVTIKAETGIADKMRNYCDKRGISVWAFLTKTIAEKLSRPVDFSIAEIEEMQKRKYEKGAQTERFDFGLSDPIMLEKLRIIREDYKIPLNTFFVWVIAEKLN